MSPIYVVINQPNYLSINVQTGIPVAAFSDFPSALNYASSIFKPQFGMDQSAKDLIFMIELTATASTTTTTVTVPSTTPASTTSTT